MKKSGAFLKFDQDFIEKVREATNIVDLIGQHVDLKKNSGGYIGLCPFHGEKSPSFSVSEDKQLYHCFGCKESGSAITFVQKFQGLTFPETIEYLAKRASISIPEAAKAPSGEKDKKEFLYRINELASKFFQYELKRLKDDSPAWKYLNGRGISRELAEKYRLGFAPDSWTALTSLCDQKRIPMFMAQTLGLIKSRGAGKEGYYDLFRNRIMFPIYSPTESCLGFGGRVLDNSQPKYLNSPDTPVFHKGTVFYGLDSAAKHIRASDTVILVEGYTDWLALVKAGFPNVVATLGTAFTSSHAHSLTRYCKNVIVLFDGDEAGKMAARRSLSIILEAGLYPKGVLLPFEMDPDEFIEQQGASALKHALDKALPLYDLILEEEMKSHSGDWSEKVQILDRLKPILASVRDERLLALYIQSTCQFLSVDEKMVRQTLSQPERNQIAKPAPPKESPEERRSIDDEPVEVIQIVKPNRSELDLLQVALSKEKYLTDVLTSGVVEQIANTGIRQVFKTINDGYGQGQLKFDNLSAWLVSRVKPSSVVTGHMEEPIRSYSEETARKLIHDCTERILDSAKRNRAKSLVTNLRGAQDDEQREKLEQFMNIQRSRRQLNHEN
jgi:DNA primase